MSSSFWLVESQLIEGNCSIINCKHVCNGFLSKINMCVYISCVFLQNTFWFLHCQNAQSIKLNIYIRFEKNKVLLKVCWVSTLMCYCFVIFRVWLVNNQRYYFQSEISAIIKFHTKTNCRINNTKILPKSWKYSIQRYYRSLL